MALHQDNTKELEVQKRLKEQVARYENDKALLSAEVTDGMRKIDMATLRNRLEAAKEKGLSPEWYVRLDRAIQDLEIWFNLKK